MVRDKKQKWGLGDFFAVPLADGSFSVGQVIATEPQALKNAPICAFFRRRVDSGPKQIGDMPTDADVVAALFVTRESLDEGRWEVFAHGPPLDLKDYFPDIEERQAKGYVGTKIQGSGIVRKLMNAYFGLHPWDGFVEPDYLDRLLVSQDRKPKSVRLKRDFPA